MYSIICVCTVHTKYIRIHTHIHKHIYVCEYKYRIILYIYIYIHFSKFILTFNRAGIFNYKTRLSCYTSGARASLSIVG